jgi:hypothetical protein
LPKQRASAGLRHLNKKEKHMSSLAAVPESVPQNSATLFVNGNLDVTITVDGEGDVTTEPSLLVVQPNFDGTITWTVNGAKFTSPAITFGGQTPPGFELSGTDTTRVWRWGNTIPALHPYSLYYTLHMIQGTRIITHDPTVENDPPTGP